MTSLRKDERFATLADAVAAVETFAAHTQLRRVQQKAAKPVATAAAADYEHDAAGGVDPDDTSDVSTADGTQNAVVLECENAPECKWFVRLALNKGEKQWKISSMNTTHHKTQCIETRADGAGAAPSTLASTLVSMEAAGATSNNTLLPNAAVSATQPTMSDELLRAAASAATAASLFPVPAAAVGGPESLLGTPAVRPTGSALSVGVTFMSWKEAIAAVRALARSMGRRAISEKPTQTIVDARLATVRRTVCQNHRNSQCEWSVVLEERSSGASADAGTAEQYAVLSLQPTHSQECLETHNFSTRKKESAAASSALEPLATTSTSSNNSTSNPTALLPPSSAAATASLLVDDVNKYELTHEMRWSTGKEATKAISDFALVVQRKRAKLCKRNNGGSNKKYVCSDEQHCLWFVQLVRGWKSKSWKISAMNLRHSAQCSGAAKPTARQLAEMQFFRHAVVTHAKASGTLLTDAFLLESAAGIAIPRGMAYRAQRLVVATSTDDVTESYKFIPSLIDAFATKNPGSTAVYEKDEHCHFVRAFVMPNAATLALLGMQHVFGVELVHYASVSYTGVLALLIGRDGNLANQVLAFALVPSSDVEHMKWFLAMCKTGGARLDACAVFCSQSEGGLVRALAFEARSVKVMFCVRSLVAAMRRDKSIPPLGAREDLVWELQRAPTEDAFARAMRQLESLNAPAAAFLRSVHATNWASHLNRATRLYDWATTNADEALTGSDVQQSDEAPFDLIYSFLAFLMDGVFQRSQLAGKLSAERPVLTPRADAVYRREFHEAAAFTVRVCDEHVAFAWRTGARPKVTHRVDLALRTCTCGRMQQLAIPCCHYVAVAQHFRNEVALLDGFDAIYKAATYAEVHRSLRIEIPAGEDLHKDSSLRPALLLRGAKAKKRARSSAPPVLTLELDDTAVSSSSSAGDAPHAKAPRLDFDSDAVAGLTELV